MDWSGKLRLVILAGLMVVSGVVYACPVPSSIDTKLAAAEFVRGKDFGRLDPVGLDRARDEAGTRLIAHDEFPESAEDSVSPAAFTPTGRDDSRTASAFNINGGGELMVDPARATGAQLCSITYDSSIRDLLGPAPDPPVGFMLLPIIGGFALRKRS